MWDFTFVTEGFLGFAINSASELLSEHFPEG